MTSAAAGRGGAVVVAGEAGIGKSALIDAVVEELDGFEVLRAAGTEFERDLLYATLHQLCAPVLEYRQRLPVVQRRALEAVFGLGAQTSPDPLTVGLAVLGLLREVAQDGPVCCVVDDAHWIDDASRRVLVFVARRVPAERIAMVFAARDVRSPSGLAELPRVPLAGLGDEDARALLRAGTHVGPDAEVIDRILAEAHGNPLALLEFAHHAEPFGVPGPQRFRASVVDMLEEQFVHRFERCPGVLFPGDRIRCPAASACSRSSRTRTAGVPLVAAAYHSPGGSPEHVHTTVGGRRTALLEHQCTRRGSGNGRRGQPCRSAAPRAPWARWALVHLAGTPARSLVAAHIHVLDAGELVQARPPRHIGAARSLLERLSGRRGYWPGPR
ncbi:hypothetical protein GCM10018779_31650 [Streptomyces griseocarneus]|nr:hypothetical protein GCM10018779_31650 [Streptomyces griseocarneus]